MVKTRQIFGILDNKQDADSDLDPPVADTTLPRSDIVAYRVQTRQSPYMDVFHDYRVVRITIDSGTTGNMIRHSTAKHLGRPIPLFLDQRLWPNVFRPVSLLTWMSFMATVLSVSPLTAAQLET